MSAPSEIRASDQEREQVASEIREHFAHGRLDTDELDERLARAYAARTRAELDALRHDLPPLPPSPTLRRAEVAERRAELTRQLIQQTGRALVPFFICTAIWFASGSNGSFWPIWVVLVALIPLVRNGWRLYGPSPEFEEVEAELRARRERHGVPPPPAPPPGR
jgi:uncharacterized membrane protein YccC